MKKTRKRLFAFSGLFVLVAQVLVMALCSIPAIAVTREETNRTLFNNEHGSATISYEEMESGGLNWTINLQKAAHDTATRFMVAMTVDGQAIMPENVQTVMQSAPEISFTAGNGEGLMLAGLQEGAAGSGAGSAVITYQTSGNYGQMAVVPKLVTVGDTVSDLLAGNPGVVYDIPVKEEPAATEEAVTGELPLTEEQTATTEAPEAEVVESTTDSQVAEATESTTESTVADEATVATEVTESTEAEATETTESSEAVVEGEATESTTEDSTATTESSSEAEDETEDSSEATEASDEAEVTEDKKTFEEPVTRASNYTGLRFEKTWVGVPTNAPADALKVQVQIKRRLAGSDWSNYYLNDEEKPEEILYSDRDTNNVTADEWHNLPLYDEDGTGPYEYTLEELPNPYYTAVQGDTVASSIDSVMRVPNKNYSDWDNEAPSFIVIRMTNGEWVVWTIDPLISQEDFKTGMKNATNIQGESVIWAKFNELPANSPLIHWYSGDYFSGSGVTVEVTYNPDGSYTTHTKLDDNSLWSQYMYGDHTTKMVPISNTYVEPKTITVKKVWDDRKNRFGKRQDVDLILQQSPVDENNWKQVDPEQKFHVSVKNEDGSFVEDNVFSKDFTLPAQGLNDAKEVVELKYRVVEKLADDSDAPVPGYENPVYSPDLNTGVSATGGILTVTNKLITTNLDFTKVKSNDESLDGVTFVVTHGDNEIGRVVSGEDGTDGHVSFDGLAVDEDYKLTEVATVNGYEIDGPWYFTVNADKSITWTGENPFDKYGNIVNNLKPFDLTVNKVDENDGDLSGATFELKDEDNVIVDTITGGPAFNFTDLKPGMSYTLTEKDAPDGYAQLLNPITITINEDGTVSIKGDDASGLEWHSDVVDGHNTISFTVTNKALVPLPATGGPGTLLFFVMGILAIAVTGIYFVSRQKQEVA